MEKILAFFNNEQDLQKAMNSIVQAGYDTINVSLIMIDKSKREESPTIDPFDEENPMSDAYGTIWSIDSEELDTEPINVPGFGEIVVAGPIVEELDKTEFDEDIEVEKRRFDEAVKLFGVDDENINDFENRINSGQILVSMKLDEGTNKEEIEMYFSDQGATLYDVY